MFDLSHRYWLEVAASEHVNLKISGLDFQTNPANTVLISIDLFAMCKSFRRFSVLNGDCRLLEMVWKMHHQFLRRLRKWIADF